MAKKKFLAKFYEMIEKKNLIKYEKL